MKTVVTGAAGFLGSRVAALLTSKQSPLSVTELVLVDKVPFRNPVSEGNSCTVHTLILDLTDPRAADQVVDHKCDILFHLAAVVSGEAETNFDLGFKANIDSTRNLLEAVRYKCPTLKFVFTSSIAVFGGSHMPSTIVDTTAATPQSSYGTTKAICELMINEYSRRGFVDGRPVRLPVVAVRSIAGNSAISSYVSSIIREPLSAVKAICPVDPEMAVWLSSPATVVWNIVHAALLPVENLGNWRVITLPGIRVSVKEMLVALREIAGDSAVSLVSFERNEDIVSAVKLVPNNFDVSRSLKLGFLMDRNFSEIIKLYICESGIKL